GQEASWAAAGILAPQLEAHGPGAFLDLMRAGVARWRGYAEMLRARTGVDAGYRDDGALEVAFDDDEAAAMRARTAWQREAGLGIGAGSAGELAPLEPALAPAVLGLRFSEGHQVDTRAAVRATVAACSAAGVRFMRGEVRRIRHDGRRVLGVDTDGEPRDAG